MSKRSNTVRRVALTPEQIAEFDDLPPYVPTEAELRTLRRDPRAKAL